MRFYAIDDTYEGGRRLDLSPLGFAGQRVSMFLQQICYLHENAEERYPVGFDFLFDSDRELSLLPRGDEEELVDGVTPLEWEVDLFIRQLSSAVATYGWKLSRFGTQKQFLIFLEVLMEDYRTAYSLFDWRRRLLGLHFDGAVGAIYRGAARVKVAERGSLDTVILTRVAKVRDALYFDWTKENLDRYFELCEELNNGGLAYLRFHDREPPLSDEELLELRTELEVQLLWNEST